MSQSMVITGCSSGFGRVTALHFARLGWRVFATVRKTQDQQSLLTEWQAKRGSGDLVPLICDVVNAAHVAELGHGVAEATPTLHALVNNAGTAFPGPLEALPIRDLRAQLEVNTIAHLAVTQALMPLLKAARGTIINVSSMGGRVAFPLTGAYHASKFALEALSDSLRIELAPFGVRVVVVEPGGSATDIWSKGEAQAQAVETSGAASVNPYRQLIENYRKLAQASARDGFPPQQFATLIEHIIASRSPRARYMLGRNVGTVIALRRFLPDWAWDAWVRRLYQW